MHEIRSNPLNQSVVKVWVGGMLGCEGGGRVEAQIYACVLISLYFYALRD